MQESLNSGTKVLIVPSHDTHLKNVMRLLSRISGISSPEITVIRRLQAPWAPLRLSNMWRKWIRKDSHQILIPRLSDTHLIDAYSFQTARASSREIRRQMSQIDVIIIGELSGEIAVLQSVLGKQTNARVVLIPEGIGIVINSSEETWTVANRSVALKSVRKGIRSSADRMTLGQPWKLAHGTRDLLKILWRLERLGGLLYLRSKKPSFTNVSRVDEIVSDWMRSPPKGLEAPQLSVVSTFARVHLLKKVNKIFFLHGPYHLGVETWQRLLAALQPHNYAGIVIKSHRDTTGLESLLLAARFFFPKNTELLGGGLLAEDCLTGTRYQVVASIDSTVLITAGAGDYGARVVSLLPTLRQAMSEEEKSLLKRYTAVFQKFERRTQEILELI